jgi:hypothetical protein
MTLTTAKSEFWDISRRATAAFGLRPTVARIAFGLQCASRVRLLGDRSGIGTCGLLSLLARAWSGDAIGAAEHASPVASARGYSQHYGATDVIGGGGEKP